MKDLPAIVWVRVAHNTGGLSVADRKLDHRYVPYVRAGEPDPAPALHNLRGPLGPENGGI